MYGIPTEFYVFVINFTSSFYIGRIEDRIEVEVDSRIHLLSKFNLHGSTDG